MIQDLNIGKQLISTKEEIKALRKKLDEMSQFPQNSNNQSNKKKLKNGIQQLDQENLINRLQYLVDKFDDSLQNKVDNVLKNQLNKKEITPIQNNFNLPNLQTQFNTVKSSSNNNSSYNYNIRGQSFDNQVNFPQKSLQRRNRTNNNTFHFFAGGRGKGNLQFDILGKNNYNIQYSQNNQLTPYLTNILKEAKMQNQKGEIQERQSKMVKQKLKAHRISKPPQILPPELRKNPFADMVPITDVEIEQKGLLNLLNTGKLPKDVDIFPAFETGAPVFRNKPSSFHHPMEKLKKQDIKIDSQNEALLYKLDKQKLLNNSQRSSRQGNRSISYQITRNNNNNYNNGKDKYDGDQSFLQQNSQENSYINIQQQKQEQNQKKRNQSQIQIKQLDVRDIEVLEYDVKQYEEVQDNFALHHIMFRKFKLVEETPEFESFKRSYQHCFSAIFHYLKQIEKVAKAYELGLFYVDGKKIVAVSKQEEKVTLDHLVDCIVNKENLKNYWKIPGRKYNGEQGKLRAILKIQSTIRMFLGRKQFEKYLSFYRKVKKIQNCVKIYLGFKRTKKRIQQKNEQIYQQFQELQAKFKEEWGIIQNKQRVEVHINSFSFDEIKRITMQKQMQRENLQISRIFRLKDPLLTIIYICPFEISQEITEYYYKILELGNVADFRSRLYFITPQNLSAFPSYFSLSKKLLYSPKSLKRIKSLIKNKTCYLFPGYPSNDDIKLCGCLNVPSLSSDPQIHLSISQKSQSRRLFEKIGVPTAIGAIEIYEIEELINTLTILLVSHPKVETWVLKIDNEFAGRGIAYLNVDSIKGFTEIVSTMKEENKEAIILNIKQKIGNQLSYKLKLAMPNLFRGFKDYIAQFCKNGGVVEAMPVGGFFQINKLQFPSVSLFIEPNGNCQITNSYDKINGAPFINIGCNFPHKSGKWQQLQKYSKKVGEELYSKGVIGCVSIDYVMFKNPQNNEEEFIQGLGIDCYLNNYNSSFIYFDFQMQGKFEVNQNIYRCKLEDGEISQRNYTYCPFLLHEGLDKLNMKSFFQSCRREGIEYDLVRKIGSTFILIDMIQSGVLSLMCINDDFQQQIDEVNKAVKFLFNNGGKLLKQNQVVGESNQDQIHLLDIQSKFSLLQEKLNQQYQMNRKKDNIRLKNNRENKYNNEQSINDGNNYQNNNNNSKRIFEEDQNGINTFNSISSSNNNNNSMIGGNSSKVKKYQHKKLFLQ